MVTVRQVGQAIAGACERHQGAKCYPIGYYNLTWNEFLAIVHRAMGQPGRQIINIPKVAFQLFGLHMRRKVKQQGNEMGIDPVGLAELMCRNTFIDPKWSKQLGVEGDDIASAIAASIRLSVDACLGRQQLLGMRGE